MLLHLLVGLVLQNSNLLVVVWGTQYHGHNTFVSWKDGVCLIVFKSQKALLFAPVRFSLGLRELLRILTVSYRISSKVCSGRTPVASSTPNMIWQGQMLEPQNSSGPSKPLQPMVLHSDWPVFLLSGGIMGGTPYASVGTFCSAWLLHHQRCIKPPLWCGESSAKHRWTGPGPRTYVT
jgi:hypothetical protein